MVAALSVSRAGIASSHWFTLPNSFDPCAELPAGLHVNADAARWVVSATLHKQAHRSTDAVGFARLRAEYIRNVTGKRQQATIIRALTSGEQPALTTAPYVVGEHARGFRLADRFDGDLPVRSRPTNPAVKDRLAAVYAAMAAEQRHRWLPVDRDLDRIQHGLSVTDLADAVVATLEPGAKICSRILLDNIRRGCPSYSVSRYGRRFNGITGLKRELRGCLRLNGSPLASIDLRCCQPAMLALLMRAVLEGTPAFGPKGVPSYKDGTAADWCWVLSVCSGLSLDPGFSDLVCRGDLFSWLADETGLSRDGSKLGFLRDFLAQYGRYDSAVAAAVRRRFPAVFDFVRRANGRGRAGDHGLVIRMLQRLESWLVVETVSPRLVRSVPVVTLHDAIFCRVGDEAEVVRAFEQVFDGLGFHVGLKIEHWAPAVNMAA